MCGHNGGYRPISERPGRTCYPEISASRPHRAKVQDGDTSKYIRTRCGVTYQMIGVPSVWATRSNRFGTHRARLSGCAAAGDQMAASNSRCPCFLGRAALCAPDIHSIGRHSVDPDGHVYSPLCVRRKPKNLARQADIDLVQAGRRLRAGVDDRSLHPRAAIEVAQIAGYVIRSGAVETGSVEAQVNRTIPGSGQKDCRRRPAAKIRSSVAGTCVPSGSTITAVSTG